MVLNCDCVDGRTHRKFFSYDDIETSQKRIRMRNTLQYDKYIIQIIYNLKSENKYKFY